MFINIFGHFRNIADGLRVPGAVTVSERRVSAAWPAAGATIPRELSRRTMARRRVPFSAFISVSLSLPLVVELFTRTYPRVKLKNALRANETYCDAGDNRAISGRACDVAAWKITSARLSYLVVFSSTRRDSSQSETAAVCRCISRHRHETTLSKFSCEIKTFRVLRRKTVTRTLRRERFVKALYG